MPDPTRGLEHEMFPVPYHFMGTASDLHIASEMATLNPCLSSFDSKKATKAFVAQLVTLEGVAVLKPDSDRLVTHMVCRCLQLDPGKRPTAEQLYNRHLSKLPSVDKMNLFCHLKRKIFRLPNRVCPENFAFDLAKNFSFFDGF